MSEDLRVGRITTLKELNDELRKRYPEFTGFKMAPGTFLVCGQVQDWNITLDPEEITNAGFSQLLHLCEEKIGHALKQQQARRQQRARDQEVCCPHCGLVLNGMRYE